MTGAEQESAALAGAAALGIAARIELGAILALSGLALTPLVTLLVRRIFPGRNVPFARWGFSHVAAVALLITALSVLAHLVLSGLEESVVLGMGATAAILGGAVLLVVHYARALDPDGVRSLGLWPGGHVRAVLSGLVAYLLLLPGLLGLGLVWSAIVEATDLGPPTQPLFTELARVPEDRVSLVVVLGVLVIPLFEEILFRVFLQPLLVQNLREKAGIAVTSFVFAALHGTSAFLPVFALSILLGAIMLRTQRLSAVWAVHALHNGIQFAALYGLGLGRELAPQTGLLALFEAAWHPLLP